MLSYEELKEQLIRNHRAVVECTLKQLEQPGAYTNYWKQQFRSKYPDAKATRRLVRRFISSEIYKLNLKGNWEWRTLKEMSKDNPA